MKAGICGALGRMGTAITGVLASRGHEVVAAFDSLKPSAGNVLQTSEINLAAIEKCTVLLDFSAPAATAELLPLAIKAAKPIVIGTTGFTQEQKEQIESAAKNIPVLFSPNMAVGVNILFKLTQIAAAAMDGSFDVEIMEIHHRHKKDAPSGTAKRLAQIVKENMSGMEDAKIISSRDGIIGERSQKEIGVMALRGGDTVGDHTVYFISEGERIELSIRSTDRNTLAKGAVLAAEYLEDKKPGLYSMFDVLRLNNDR